MLRDGMDPIKPRLSLLIGNFDGGGAPFKTYGKIRMGTLKTPTPLIIQFMRVLPSTLKAQEYEWSDEECQFLEPALQSCRRATRQN